MYTIGYFSLFFLLGVCISHIETIKIPHCPENEIYNASATKCLPEPTCQAPVPTCPNVCKDGLDPRCECCDGYIRDTAKWKCVLPCECPACPINEIMNENACSCLAEPTCQNPSPCSSEHCEPETIQRCECEEGYTRDETTNECVLECSVCSQCGENEVQNDHAWSCTPEPTCQTPNPVKNHLCVNKIITRCECDAKNGYIRNDLTQECVPKEECNCCEGPHEEYACKPCCDITCKNYKDKKCPGPCPRICEYGCVCQDGYIRDKHTNKCLPVSLMCLEHIPLHPPHHKLPIKHPHKLLDFHL